MHTVASASRCGTSPSNQGSFEVQTTNLSAGDTFAFYVGAEGTFTVNWGDGTSETYNNTIVQTGTGSGTITRNQYGNEPYFSHTYSSGGVKNITITGCATKYRDWQIVRWTTLL